MNQLSGRVIVAHGGMGGSRGFDKLEATIVAGSGFIAGEVALTVRLSLAIRTGRTAKY